MNFFITILWNELRDVVRDAVDIEYQTFTALVKNPVTLRRFVASTLDISAKEAKKLLIKILHWGRPSHPLLLLWALAVQTNVVNFLSKLYRGGTEGWGPGSGPPNPRQPYPELPAGCQEIA